MSGPESDSTRSSDRKPNRLAGETSPYLLQHAHNPVDWWPWCPEALAEARRLNRPVFLSVGYSTCYWCHVMERQCFENDAIAALMNAELISIKVDREERPDIDQLYMSFVQLSTGQGGWPMSVFLTGDAMPFFGGTYFPPQDAYGRPGFSRVIGAVAESYRKRRSAVEESARNSVEVLQKASQPIAPPRTFVVDEKWVQDLIDRSTVEYDTEHGGFGTAPKFPRQTLLELLLVHNRRENDPVLLGMVTHSLDAMARGGIRDHLGGGFHRYSTDEKWLIPHFEIMLYDNAMLAWLYVEAFRQTQEPRFAAVARGILDFVLREMTGPGGEFFTAIDAEVDGVEGRSYLWTEAEVEAVLGLDDARLFNRIYALDDGPNFVDPHHGGGVPEFNVLHRPQDPVEAARSLGMTPAELEDRLARLRQKLLFARHQRKQPILDTKVLTSWNALMIRALAYAGRTLSDAAYLAAAERATEWLLQHHRDAAGELIHTSRNGQPKQAAFLDDYAMVVQSLLSLEAAGFPSRRAQAEELADRMLRRFAPSAGGALYFTGEDATDLSVRQIVGGDSPLPSGNAVAASALITLGRQEAAWQIIRGFAGSLIQGGDGMMAMVRAAWLYVIRFGSMGVEPPRVAAPGDGSQAQANAVSIGAAWIDPKTLRVTAIVTSGYHINSNVASAGMIATRLIVAGDTPADTAAIASAVERINYPAAVKKTFAFTDEDLMVYEGQIQIDVFFRQPMIGKPAVVLRLHYHACTDSECQLPGSAQFRMKGCMTL
jgi:uncharacterized protein YyaL (SSP411 family)